MADRPGESSPLPGKSFTADKILIGIGWTDLNALAAVATAATGYGGEGFGGAAATTRDYAEAVVKYVNAHGGIAARAIEPVYHEYPATALLRREDRQRAEQEMCATFTEDHRVFAMVPGTAGGSEGLLSECARKTDTPYVAVVTFEEGVDEQRFAEIGRWWYRPNWLSAERRERTMAARLVAQDFFSPGAKVGLMIAGDRPVYRRGVERALKPALAEAGVEVVAEAVYPDRLDSPWANYVLQFRTAGVTHVIFSHSSTYGTATSFFMQAAENQRWRPRYGLASDVALDATSRLAPHEQLKGAGGIGWSPADERGRGRMGEPPATSAEGLCQKIMSDAGFSEASADIVALAYCEGLFFLKAALDRAPSLTTAGLLSSVEALGDSYVPVMTWATRFGPDRHDGATTVRDIAWRGECECFVYTSGPHPVHDRMS